VADDELKQLFDSIRQENRRHFEIGFESLINRCDELIESIVALGEKLDRRFSALDARLERGFAETQAILRFPKSTTF
jgi:hypothetical protein